MIQPLFRTEVMQARQAAWLGGIRVGHKPKFSAVAGVALLLAGCLVTFAVWGQAARKSRIPGVLIPGPITGQLRTDVLGTPAKVQGQEGSSLFADGVVFYVTQPACRALMSKKGSIVH